MHRDQSILRGDRACAIFRSAATIVLFLFALAVVIIIWHERLSSVPGLEILVQVIGGCLGVLGVIAAPVIFFGMLIYIIKYDSTSKVMKLVWLIFFLLTGWVGASVYFFVSYRGRECLAMQPIGTTIPVTHRGSPQEFETGPQHRQVHTFKASKQPMHGSSFLQGQRAYAVFMVCAWITLILGAFFGVSLAVYDLVFEAIPQLVVPAQITGMCLGAVGIVVCSVLLVGMTMYLIRCDETSRTHKAMWLLSFILVAWIAPTVYFFIAYCKRKCPILSALT